MWGRFSYCYTYILTLDERKLFLRCCTVRFCVAITFPNLYLYRWIQLSCLSWYVHLNVFVLNITRCWTKLYIDIFWFCQHISENFNIIRFVQFKCYCGIASIIYTRNPFQLCSTINATFNLNVGQRFSYSVANITEFMLL